MAEITNALIMRKRMELGLLAVGSGRQDDSGWHALPADLKAMVVARRIEDALEMAERVTKDKFFTDDGPESLRQLCAALSDLLNLKLTDKSAYDAAVQFVEPVLVKLRTFLGKVMGWEKRNPDDNVARMCMQLEKLLSSKNIPPPLSRMRARELPFADSRAFRQPRQID